MRACAEPCCADSPDSPTFAEPCCAYSPDSPTLAEPCCADSPDSPTLSLASFWEKCDSPRQIRASNSRVSRIWREWPLLSFFSNYLSSIWSYPLKKLVFNNNNNNIQHDIEKSFSHPKLANTQFVHQVWVQRGDNRPLSPGVLEDGQLLISAEVEWDDGRRLPIQPFHLLRSRLRYFKTEH